MYVPNAIRGLQRLREILKPMNPAAAKRVGKTIRKSLQVLKHNPHIGRPIEGMPAEYRTWLIRFDTGSYVALYRVDSDFFSILSVRHSNEVGYSE